MEREELIQILVNHTNEERMLRQQFSLIKEQAEAEREKLYPSGLSYDKPKVMGGVAYDERLSAMVDKINKIYQQNERNLNYITNRLRDIKYVYSVILRMPPEQKTALLALYYPNRSQEQAASKLNISRSEMLRRKEEALVMLIKEIKQG